MWARSHTSGLISGLCWTVSSASAKSVSCRVRLRAASRPRAVCSRMRFLLEYGEWAVLLDAASQLAAGRASGRDQLGVVLDLVAEAVGCPASGQVDTRRHRRADQWMLQTTAS